MKHKGMIVRLTIIGKSYGGCRIVQELYSVHIEEYDEVVIDNKIFLTYRMFILERMERLLGSLRS